LIYPNTRLFKTSIPEPDPDKVLETIDKEIVISKKQISEFACKFADRCPKKMPICEKQEPGNYTIDGRIVKCHLYSS